MFLSFCRFSSGGDRGAVPNAIVGNLFIQLNHEMSVESGFLTVSLVDAVYGVVTGNFFFLRIDFDEGDTFITIGFDHDVVVAILFEAELHDACTGESGQFGMDVIVVQVDRIIGGSCCFLSVIESGGAFDRVYFELIAERHNCDAAVVLCTGAVHPVAGPESLDCILEIIVGRMTFLFGRLCLCHPVGHTVWNPDCRHDLSAFFRRVLVFSLYDADICTDQRVYIFFKFIFLLVA